MRQAELDIVTADGTRYNDTMEIDSNADLTDIVTVAQQLLGICRWQKVRVGVGSQLSDWITEPIKTNPETKMNHPDFQPYYSRGQRIWTPAELDYLNAHVAEGWDSIAAALHRDRISVRQKYANLHPPRRPGPADITLIRKLRYAGKTLQDIADAVGFSVDTVRRTLKNK